MSYCVNCGVELDDSQKSCPLCHVPVQNPLKPWKEPEQMPYPRLVQNVLTHIDRSYGVSLISIALAIPVLCSILIDIFANHALTWSSYVTGGAVCLFVWVLLPLLLKRPKVYLHIMYNTLAAQAYAAAIFLVNGSIMTYVSFAMPIIFAVCALSYAQTPVFRSKRLRGRLYKPAIILFQLPFFLVVLELIIDLNLMGVFQPAWSLVAASPCIVLGIMLVILERKNQLKDKIIRRLFA